MRCTLPKSVSGSQLSDAMKAKASWQLVLTRMSFCCTGIGSTGGDGGGATGGGGGGVGSGMTTPPIVVVRGPTSSTEKGVVVDGGSMSSCTGGSVG